MSRYDKTKNKRHRSEAEKKAIARWYAQKNESDVTYPHFRKFLKSNHPALIVSERSDVEYNYRKVTHSERENGKLNEKVFPNPNPRDKEPMYIGKRVRYDNKKYFSTWSYPWKYPKK